MIAGALILLAIGLGAISSSHPSVSQEAQRGFRPIEVGDGPLLYFVEPDALGGLSNAYLHEPGSEREPMLFWRGGSSIGAIPRPIARIRAELLVVEFDDQAFLLDLAGASTTRLAATDGKKEVVEVRDDTVYFLDRRYVGEGYGMALGQAEDGRKIIVDRGRRSRSRLFSRTLGGVVSQVGACEIEHLWDIEDRGFVVTTFGAEPSLVRIGRDGTVEPILALPSTWVLEQMHPTLSPDGRYLALSVLHDRHDVMRTRDLVVVDLQQRKIQIEEKDIDVSAFPTWSNLPRVAFDWMSDRVLCRSRYSRAGIEHEFLDVAAARTLTDEESKPVRSPEAAPTRRFLRGSFELEYGDEGGLIYFVGDEHPSGRASNGHIEVSPDGRWAVCPAAGEGLDLLDAEARCKTTLPVGRDSLGWLPAGSGTATGCGWSRPWPR